MSRRSFFLDNYSIKNKYLKSKQNIFAHINLKNLTIIAENKNPQIYSNRIINKL